MPEPMADKGKIKSAPIEGNDQFVRGYGHFKLVQVYPVYKALDGMAVIKANNRNLIHTLIKTARLYVQIYSFSLERRENPPYFSTRESMLEKHDIFPVRYGVLQFLPYEFIPRRGKNVSPIIQKLLPG